MIRFTGRTNVVGYLLVHRYYILRVRAAHLTSLCVALTLALLLHAVSGTPSRTPSAADVDPVLSTSSTTVRRLAQFISFPAC